VGELLIEEFGVTQRNKSGERKSPDAILELWKEYSETAAPSVRDRLVLTLAPMVKYIVFRKLREIPARCEIEDFLSKHAAFLSFLDTDES